MAACGRYRAVNNVDMERLIEAFENNQADYLQLADTLGIKRSTARSIVTTYLRTGRHEKLPTGEAHNTRVDQEIQDELKRLLDENPLLTLKQMKDYLQHSLQDKPQENNQINLF